MHTFDGKETTIHYNSDLSGDVVILRKSDDAALEVNGDDIAAFVLSWVQRQAIGALENLDFSEIVRNWHK